MILKSSAGYSSLQTMRKDILDPLFDRFETYFLTEYTDDEFKAIAVKRLKKEGIEDEELSL